MSWFLAILILLLAALLVYVSLMMIKFSDIIVQMEQRTEKCLDELDFHYRQLGDILKIPVFHNDPVVRDAIQIIRNSQIALLRIAGRLAEPTTKKRDENESEEE